MFELMIPHSRFFWLEGRKLMGEGKFEDSINYLHGALVSCPPGDSSQKFNILLDLGYSVAVAYDSLCSAAPIFERAFGMVRCAPNDSKAQLYNNLSHCYLEELIDEFDFEKKAMLGYQALALVMLAKEYYHATNDKPKLYSATELEEEIRREIGDLHRGVEELFLEE